MLILLLIASVLFVMVFTRLVLWGPSVKTTGPALSEETYQIENKRVYYFGDEGTIRLIEDAHARTFQVLTPGNDTAGRSMYARDFQHVYYRGRILPGADPVHFQILGPDLARDDKHVFKAFQLISADARNFKCLDRRLSKDSHRVFFDDCVISEDPGNFRFICRWQKTCVYKDRCKVFFNGNGYRVADIDTFKFIGDSLFADSKNAYKLDESGFQSVPGEQDRHFEVRYQPAFA